VPMSRTFAHRIDAVTVLSAVATTAAIAGAIAASLAALWCDRGRFDVPGGEATVAGPSSGCSGACHGEGDLLAPPRDTAGRTDLQSIGIGAHTQHLAASDWHTRFTCE